MRTTFSEEELVAILKTGKPEGLGILHQMYSRVMLMVIRKLIKDRPIAEDTLQMVWLKVWSEARQYDSAKGRIYTWLICIARNAAIDTYRSKAYKTFLKSSDFEDYQEDREEFTVNDYNPDVIGLRQIVGRLEEHQREVLQLVYFQGFTHIEAAQHLKMPLGSVKTRVRCGLRNLRQFFNEDGRVE